ncbi:unnamed protein product [Acanthosepion pharaonis]|uniref:Uncharacterized protein n=1 Tax=Acanthosepion pharaonis TaxID=158019 RepID=A0A812EP33_ACAPH|nr:unnamed protein product [Sepia pharaonis]
MPVIGGSGNIFLADVECNGTEGSILRCDHNNFEHNDCQHESDVGVNCEETSDEITMSNSVGDCSFEYGSCGYTNQGNSSFKWEREYGSTPSGWTGPSTDHTHGTTSGYYMYTEASSGDYGDKTYLASPISNYSPLSVSFWYHMYGSDMGTLNVKTV